MGTGAVGNAGNRSLICLPLYCGKKKKERRKEYKKKEMYNRRKE